MLMSTPEALLLTTYEILTPDFVMLGAMTRLFCTGTEACVYSSMPRFCSGGQYACYIIQPTADPIIPVCYLTTIFPHAFANRLVNPYK